MVVGLHIKCNILDSYIFFILELLTSAFGLHILVALHT